MCAEALRLLRAPRQLSMWNLVNGSPVSSKNLGQLIEAGIQADRLVVFGD